jgi:transcriptional regulator with XRE-family HTH domain
VARQPEHLADQQRTLGRYLAALREAAGLYQADIARAVPCHRTTVTHAEAGSQLPASDFWEIADRVVGADGALIARYDELIHAKAAHLAEQQAQRRAQAQATVQQLTAAPPLRPGEARREGSAGGLPAVPVEGSRMRRRETIKLGLAVAITPEILGRVLSDAATEALEFTQLTALSSVGQGTLDHLELVISDLNRAYMKDPPAEQFVVARVYRSRVDELIRGRHTLKELQALSVHAACLSELLAWLAYDLGNFRTAQAYALDCYAYADEAGHGELCGWAAHAMAAIAIDSEHPDRAAKAAMQGVAKISASHPLTVRLRAHAACAYARLGQRESCETLFGEAQQLYERLPARAPCRFTKDTGIHASYAMTAYPASAYLRLRDFETARTRGETALAALESAPPGSGSPYRQAQTQLVLATSLVGLGTPDEAVALGSQTLTSTRMVSPLVAQARDLDRALVSRYPKLACVREFHEQYRHVAQRSTAAQGES